jgi:hypothetical protein
MKVVHLDLGGILLYYVYVDAVASCPQGHSVRLTARSIFCSYLNVSDSLASICVRESGLW